MRSKINTSFSLFKRFSVSLKLAFAYLLLIILFAIFADVIANDVPIVIKSNGQLEYPIKDRSLYLSKSFKKDSVELIVNSPVKFYYSSLDQNAGTVSPGYMTIIDGEQKYHWLGTDTYTRDVLAGIIHGSRIAIWVGLISTLLSCLIGLFLGSISGYYNDNKLKINKILLVALLLVSISYAYFKLWNPGLLMFFRFDIILLIIGIGLVLLALTGKPKIKKTLSIPIDTIIMKAIEIFQSIPGLFLLICLISIFETNNVIKLSLIIGLLRWPTFTRLVRGETLKIKNTEYVQSARALGILNFGIIIKHIWPNLFRQVLVAFSYGVGSAVLLEASLSFLGLGLSPDTVTWGSLLSQSRLQVSVWWLALFPGMMITLLIASCYTIGTYLISDDKEKLKGLI